MCFKDDLTIPGEVYRARDTKLGRDVAIKVLTEEFSQDKERLERFEREARLLAQINHANIATLYGLEEHDGQQFLVMEMVEGETLAERIARGPIPLDEALPLFIELAEGLEAAHEKGIIHRDFKPANIKTNIKIGSDGKPKILDFGLAKAFVADTKSAADSSQSPTLTKGTALGTIMGTASYMSPEQARGQTVDKRTDIWAYGCCLYESLTGRRAFDGHTVTDVLAAVIGKEPDLSKLSDEVPWQIPRLLRRCFEKDPRERAPDIGMARLEIKEALASPLGTIGATPGRLAVSRRVVLLMIASVVVVAALAGFVGWNLARPERAPRPVTRAVILLDENVRLASSWDEGIGVRGRDIPVALSQDGSEIFFVGERDGRRLIYRRPVDRLDAEPIRGTEGAAFVFPSPDGEWLGFYADRKLQKVRLNGEAPVTFHTGRVWAAAWGPNGTVVFTENNALWEIDTVGGEPRRLTSEGRYRGQPSFLPGGRSVLANARRSGQIVVIPLATGQPQVLTNGTAPQFVPSGHIVFRRESSLWAVPFDADRLEVKGGAVQVLQGSVQRGTMPNFALSASGTLVYTPAVGLAPVQQLVWVDREGKEEVLPLEPGSYRIPRISADQSRVVFDDCCPQMHPPTGDIWIYDLAARNTTRLTFDPIGEFHPLWTPDDERVAFYSYGRSLDWKASTGSGDVSRLTEASNAVPQGFSPDGRVLTYADLDDIFMVRLDGDGTPEPLVATPARENGGYISPDGRWLAYTSDESGRSEIYVRPFPEVDEGRWQVSTNGGTEASWALDGRELFYRDGDKMMRVEVAATSAFAYKPPQVLFEGLYDTHANRNYDVARDGRFLMVKDVTPSDQASARKHLVLVQNWLGELERLVPTEN